MEFLNLTLDEMAQNLALDEALLETAEQNNDQPACLRIWESASTAVVLGRSSQVNQEVNTKLCRKNNVPIYRRCSGGATIATGPGCLMYAVLISYRDYPHLRMIDQAHQFVLEKICASLSKQVSDIAQQGVSDLTWQGRKFSGNSLRGKQNHLLYHGTILYDFPINQIAQLLKSPSRQPAYRRQRSHTDFLANLPLDREAIIDSLKDAFAANQPITDWPEALVQELTEQRYSNPSWTDKY